MINEIRKKVQNEEYEFSKHATDQSIIRNIFVSEIKHAILRGEIIEDYPNDKYGPSCLIFRVTDQNRPIHVQCSYPSRDLIKIITVYEPNINDWIEYRIRRS